MSKQNKGYVININELPEKYPTHMHQSNFWESLGRTVATFGFLEEIITKAIFALTATRQYEEDEAVIAYGKWVKRIERTISDPLGGLIITYEKSLKEHPDITHVDYDQFMIQLKSAKAIRDVICHGSWGAPNENGASLPFFINRNKEKFETEIDCEFLDQVQNNVKELACEVINSVTIIGWQFPSSGGPGKNVW